MSLQEKVVQLIPMNNIGLTDEFEGIKKISSQEIIVAHHHSVVLSGHITPRRLKPR